MLPGFGALMGRQLLASVTFADIRPQARGALRSASARAQQHAAEIMDQLFTTTRVRSVPVMSASTRCIVLRISCQKPRPGELSFLMPSTRNGALRLVVARCFGR
jgi:hypothetical protein